MKNSSAMVGALTSQMTSSTPTSSRRPRSSFMGLAVWRRSAPSSAGAM